MKKYPLYLSLVVGIAGCVTSSPKSDWIVLDAAESLDCGKWPQNADDLRIDDIVVLNGANPHLLISAINRKGNPHHYTTPFAGDVDIDEDSIKPLPLGMGSLLFGGMSHGGKQFIVVGRNKGENSVVEVRELRTNVVVNTFPLAKSHVIEGKLSVLGNAYWLQYKLDGDGVRLARLQETGKGLGFQKISGLEFDQYPVLLAGQEAGAALVMWASGSKTKPFRVRAIDKSGKIEKESVLDVPVSSLVESWSAVDHDGAYALAYIDGDSLVGQARLRVIGFGLNYGVAQATWNREIPMRDVHVTEPALSSQGSVLDVMMLNWVDEESTIARYVFRNGEQEEPVYLGVFPKGARIVDRFRHDSDDYLVMRHREGSGWSFEFCEI